MVEETRTYSQRVFTMNNGLVLAVKLDDWYWQHYDWLVSEQGNYDADTVREFCYDVSKNFAQEKNLDSVSAFRHTLGYWIQEGVKFYDLDPTFQSY